MEMVSFAVISWFVVTIALCDSKEAKALHNQECKLRETLVHVDKLDNTFFPLIVKLHRCGGACRNFPPTVKKCVASSFEDIPVRVKRMPSFKEETIVLRNETSCKCSCVEDESNCSKETQIFKKRECKCGCKDEYRSIHRACVPPFQWDTLSCSCRCELRCGHMKDLDPKSCRCYCKQDAYTKCARINRHMRPDTCECLEDTGLGRSTGKKTCQDFPRKWIPFLIIFGAVIFFVLIFDCTLYCKKMGVFHSLVHCCGKEFKRQSQESCKGTALSSQDDAEF